MMQGNILGSSASSKMKPKMRKLPGGEHRSTKDEDQPELVVNSKVSWCKPRQHGFIQSV